MHKYYQRLLETDDTFGKELILKGTFAGECQLKYMDGIWTKKSILK